MRVHFRRPEYLITPVVAGAREVAARALVSLYGKPSPQSAQRRLEKRETPEVAIVIPTT